MKLSSLFTVFTALFTIVVVRESEAANVVQCGDIISEKTKLNDHLECDCNKGPALIVKSANLNMNKKNVSCQASNKGEFQGVITLLGKKSKVSNGFVISNNDQYGVVSYGVVLGGVGKHQLSNVEAVGFYNGIVIDEASSKNTISKCLSKDSHDGGFSVYSKGNTLEQNMATSNDNDVNYVLGNSGFYVFGNSNTLEQNVVTSNNYNQNGFYVTGNSNTLKGNKATGSKNEGDGFVIYGNSNTLQQNVASNNEDGFYVGGNSNTLKQNEAKENETNGFVIYGNSNTLKQNEAKENLIDGIYVGGNSNALKRNKATRNRRIGFFIYDTTTGNTVKKNKAAENGFADYKVNCMATTFVKNKGNDPCSVG